MRWLYGSIARFACAFWTESVPSPHLYYQVVNFTYYWRRFADDEAKGVDLGRFAVVERVAEWATSFQHRYIAVVERFSTAGVTELPPAELERLQPSEPMLPSVQRALVALAAETSARLGDIAEALDLHASGLYDCNFAGLHTVRAVHGVAFAADVCMHELVAHLTANPCGASADPTLHYMPELETPHRANVVVHALRARFGSAALTGVEVGVATGETSAILLAEGWVLWLASEDHICDICTPTSGGEQMQEYQSAGRVLGCIEAGFFLGFELHAFALV